MKRLWFCAGPLAWIWFWAFMCHNLDLPTHFPKTSPWYEGPFFVTMAAGMAISCLLAFAAVGVTVDEAIEQEKKQLEKRGECDGK